MKVYSSHYLKRSFLRQTSAERGGKRWKICIGEKWRSYTVQNLAKQQGPHMNRNGNTSRRCRSWKNYNDPTTSNVPAAEESATGCTPNLEDDNASTNVSIDDNDSDEFVEEVSDEQQAKKYLGTNRKINFQEEALHLEKRKIKFMEERLMKSLKPTNAKSACSYWVSYRSLRNWTTFQDWNSE